QLGTQVDLGRLGDLESLFFRTAVGVGYRDRIGTRGEVAAILRADIPRRPLIAIRLRSAADVQVNDAVVPTKTGHVGHLPARIQIGGLSYGRTSCPRTAAGIRDRDAIGSRLYIVQVLCA